MAATPPPPLPSPPSPLPLPPARTRAPSYEGCDTDRSDIEVQTEQLEEIVDRLVEVDVASQTDAALERPPSPLFVPQPRGIDVGTEIGPTDLWDFEREVEPLVEGIVERVVQRSLRELQGEGEVTHLLARQLHLLRLRAAHLHRTQRLEHLERLAQHEKRMRVVEEQRRVAEQQRRQSKLDARSFAQRYLQKLTPGVIDQLVERGYFYDVVMREVEMTFVPSLLSQTEEVLTRHSVAEELLHDLLRSAIVRLSSETSVTPENNVSIVNSEEVSVPSPRVVAPVV